MSRVLVVAGIAAVLALTACEPPGGMISTERCHFQGNDVVCVQHWDDGRPDTTTIESPDYNTVAGDPGADYEAMGRHWDERHPHAAWPPAPEPGREQYLTPYEDALPDDFRPFAPERHCRDGSAWWDLSKMCPDGNPGTITWVHNDGTVVTIGPNSPTGIRWNGGEVR